MAALVALLYIAVVAGGVLIHYFQSGDLSTLRFSLLLPSTLIALLLASIVAWGLWRRLRWAWWFALVASAIQLVRMSTWLWQYVSRFGLPGPSVLLVLAVLLLFFVILLSPGTRAACVR